MDKNLKLSFGIDAAVIGFFIILLKLIQYIFIDLSSKIDFLALTNLQTTITTDPLLAKETLTHMLTSYSFLGVSIILTVILLFFSYSVSRNYLWSNLNKKSFIFKNSWRWLSLPFLFFLLFLPYLLISLILKYFVNFLVAKSYNQMLLTLTDQLFLVLALIIFAYFIFATHHAFSKSRKSWESLGTAFNLVNKSKKTLGKILLIAIIVNVLVALIAGQFPLQTTLINIASVVITFIFLSWARIEAFHAFKKH